MKKKYIFEDVKDFYNDNELVLIGMNDYANTSILFKNILKYIEEEIEQTGLLINAASLTLNKVEHMNLMLEHNLSVSEIKIAQLLSIYDGISNLFLETLGEKGKNAIDKVLKERVSSVALKYPTEMDDRINITDIIHEAKAPIIIHSTGANNLMRTLGTNPYTIKKYFEKDCSKYQYAYQKAYDPKTISEVIKEVEKSFENIIAINPNAIIFSLGLYIQKVFKNHPGFVDLITEYNERLEKLCDEYLVTYVDTASICKFYENKLIDFNLSRNGQKALAKTIVCELQHYLKSVNYEPEVFTKNETFTAKPKNRIVTNLRRDAIKLYSNSDVENTRTREIIFQTGDEKIRESKIYEETFELVKRRQNI